VTRFELVTDRLQSLDQIRRVIARTELDHLFDERGLLVVFSPTWWRLRRVWKGNPL